MKKIVIGCLTLLCSHVLFAQSQLELLNEPAHTSQLASNNVLLNAIKHEDTFIAVGERGHIIQWTNQQDWHQFVVPVSVTITDMTLMLNGNFLAVGHDGLILVFDQDTQEWGKVFDGYKLTDLLITSLQNQIDEQVMRLDSLPENADIYEEEYYLEDLQFALEDAQKEQQAGPNKPFLSAVTADNGSVFVIGAYGTVLQSKDNGRSWNLVSHKFDNPDKFHLNAISKNATGQLFVVGENAVAARSNNNGESWERMELPYHGSFFGIQTAPNSDHLVAFGLQGHIAVSADGGTSWTLSPKKMSISLLGGTVDENGIVYLVGHGGLIVTFPITSPEQQSIYKHPSGSTFSSVMVDSNKQLVLVGQQGIMRWAIGH